MSLANYTDLQNAITSHLGRPGDTVIPVADLITMAEAEFNRVLRTQQQVKTTPFTTIAGFQSYSLPTDIIAPLEFRVNTTDPRIVLEQLSPVNFDNVYQFNITGQPANFTIIAKTVHFGPTPDGEYTIQLRYYSKIPPLSTATPTNWLLTDHPDAYLFQCLRHAHTFLGADNPDLQIYEQRAGMAIASIKQQDIRNKTGGAPIRMRTFLTPRDSVFPR